jgi:hypothetical protein
MPAPQAPLPRRKPELFRQIYGIAAGQNAILGTVLAGHLVIEFLLTELAVQKLGGRSRPDIEALTHAKLISKNKSLHIVEEPLASLLNSINRFRNRFAHELDFQPSKHEWLDLFEKAEATLSDRTNGLYQGLEELRTETPLDRIEAWVFAELFIQTAYDLHALYVASGGDKERFVDTDSNTNAKADKS